MSGKWSWHSEKGVGIRAPRRCGCRGRRSARVAGSHSSNTAGLPVPRAGIGCISGRPVRWPSTKNRDRFSQSVPALSWVFIRSTESQKEPDDVLNVMPRPEIASLLDWQMRGRAARTGNARRTHPLRRGGEDVSRGEGTSSGVKGGRVDRVGRSRTTRSCAPSPSTTRGATRRTDHPVSRRDRRSGCRSSVPRPGASSSRSIVSRSRGQAAGGGTGSLVLMDSMVRGRFVKRGCESGIRRRPGSISRRARTAGERFLAGRPG